MEGVPFCSTPTRSRASISATSVRAGAGTLRRPASVHRRADLRHRVDSQALASHRVDVPPASAARRRARLHKAAHGIGLAQRLSMSSALALRQRPGTRREDPGLRRHQTGPVRCPRPHDAAGPAARCRAVPRRRRVVPPVVHRGRHASRPHDLPAPRRLTSTASQPHRLHCRPMPALRTIRTVCPRNCYCTCGMLVTLDEHDRIVSIEGDPENPATGGHVCLKGLSYARRANLPRPDPDAASPARIGRRTSSRSAGRTRLTTSRSG